MNALTVLILAAAAATVVSLVSGISSMTRGGEAADVRSEHWMEWRVLFQGIALVLMVIALFIHH
jgi:hypothetical protein